MANVDFDYREREGEREGNGLLGSRYCYNSTWLQCSSIS